MVYNKIFFMPNLLDVFKNEKTEPKKLFNWEHIVITADLFDDKPEIVITPEDVSLFGIWIPQESLLIIQHYYFETDLYAEKLYNQGITVFCDLSWFYCL